MNKLFPNQKTWIVPNVVSNLVMIIFFVTLVGSGCDQDRIANLETKIGELESKIQAQENKIRVLAFTVTLSKASVFDPPLKQFFAADEFWEVVYPEPDCWEECYKQFKDEMEHCQGLETEEARSECMTAAMRERISCDIACKPWIYIE